MQTTVDKNNGKKEEKEEEEEAVKTIIAMNYWKW